MPNNTPPASLSIDAAALTPLVRQIVTEAQAALEADRTRLDGQEVYTESEAARWLRLADHQLRDERRRGRIAASRIVGGKIRYTRADLIQYLAQRRIEQSE